MAKKRILIDANSIVPMLTLGQFSGIGRTTQELIMALDKIRDELPFEIELYTQNIRGISAKRLNTGFKTRHAYLRNIPKHNEWAKKLHIRELLSRYDLQHIPHNYEIVTDPSRCIATVHDAFFMKFDADNHDYSVYRKIYPPFIRYCRHILTCSEYSKKDIVETMGVNPDKVTVTHWGIDHSNFYREKDKRPIVKYLSEKFGIQNNYFLSLSCNANRKRTPQLIRAFAKGNYHNDLVILWKTPPKDIQEIIDSHPKIHQLGDVPDSDLRKLYNCATAAIHPTTYEGFGLPILEAMACGCPSVTCRNSSLVEVGGEAAIYLDEPVESSLSSMMDKLESDRNFLTEHIQIGLDQAAKFTWENTARKTAQLYLKELQSL